MPSKNTGSKQEKRRPVPPASVDAFIAALEPPLKDVVIELRRIILEADPSISEGIKWNVPSFRTSEYFATLNLRVSSGTGVIMHFGAKKTALSTTGVEIDDPDSLLAWLAKDRAMVTFRDLDEIRARRSAFTQLVREWISHVV